MSPSHTTGVEVVNGLINGYGSTITCVVNAEVASHPFPSTIAVIEYVVIGILFGITFTNPVVFGGVIFIVCVFCGVSSSTTVIVNGGDPTDISAITSTSNP